MAIERYPRSELMPDGLLVGYSTEWYGHDSLATVSLGNATGSLNVIESRQESAVTWREIGARSVRAQQFNMHMKSGYLYRLSQINASANPISLTLRTASDLSRINISEGLEPDEVAATTTTPNEGAVFVATADPQGQIGAADKSYAVWGDRTYIKDAFGRWDYETDRSYTIVNDIETPAPAVGVLPANMPTGEEAEALDLCTVRMLDFIIDFEHNGVTWVESGRVPRAAPSSATPEVTHESADIPDLIAGVTHPETPTEARIGANVLAINAATPETITAGDWARIVTPRSRVIMFKVHARADGTLFVIQQDKMGIPVYPVPDIAEGQFEGPFRYRLYDSTDAENPYTQYRVVEGSDAHVEEPVGTGGGTATPTTGEVSQADLDATILLLRNEADAKIEALVFERNIGPRGGITLAMSPYALPAGEEGDWIYTADEVDVNGTTYSKDTALRYIRDSVGGIPADVELAPGISKMLTQRLPIMNEGTNDQMNDAPENIKLWSNTESGTLRGLHLRDPVLGWRGPVPMSQPEKRTVTPAELLVADQSGDYFLLDGVRSGPVQWDGSNNANMITRELSTSVGNGATNALHFAPTSDPTGASGVFRRVGWETVDSRWFNTGDNLTDTLKACRQIGRMYPDTEIHLEGITYTRTDTSGSLVPEVRLANVKIKGKGIGKTVFRQEMTAGGFTNKAMIWIDDTSEYFEISDLTLDGNDSVLNITLLYGEYPHNSKLDRVEFIKWDRAITFISSPTRASENIDMIDVRVTDASTVQNAYPVQIEAARNCLPIRNLYVRDFVGEGPGIPYDDTDTPGVGDFFAIKNVLHWKMIRPSIKGGGELGIAPSWFSRYGLIENPHVSGCDADGIGAGNSQYSFATSGDESLFQNGETVTFENGGTGVIDAIFQNRILVGFVKFDGASTDIPRDGNTVTGATSGQVQTISEIVQGLENVQIMGGTITGNGIDGNATGDVYAAMKFIGGKNITADNVDCTDLTGVQKRGLHIVSTDGYGYSNITTTGFANGVVITGVGVKPLSRAGVVTAADYIATPRKANVTLDAAGYLEVSADQTRYRINPNGTLTTQDLNGFTGTVPDGHQILISPATNADTLVVKHFNGRIPLPGNADVSLVGLSHSMALIYDGVANRWYEVGGR